MSPNRAVEDILSGFGQIGSEGLATGNESLQKEIDSLNDNISSALNNAADAGSAAATSAPGDPVATTIEDILAGFDRIVSEELDPIDAQIRNEIDSLNSSITSAIEDASGVN